MSSPAPRQEAEVCKIKGLRGHTVPTISSHGAGSATLLVSGTGATPLCRGTGKAVSGFVKGTIRVHVMSKDLFVNNEQ